MYAEQLGLDSRLYVDEYNARFASDDELTPGRVQRPKGSRRLSLESHAVIMAVVGIIAVTVLVIAAWQVGSPGGGSAPTVETVGPPPPASESAPQPAPIEPTPAPVVPAPPPPPAPVAPSVEEPAPVVNERAKLVLIAADGRSRILVRKGTRKGKVMYDAVLKKGERKRFSAKTPIRGPRQA